MIIKCRFALLTKLIFYLAALKGRCEKLFAYETGQICYKCDSYTVVYWTKGNNTITSTKGHNTLYIKNVSESDAGKYVCHGTKLSKNKQFQSFAKEIEVIVAVRDNSRIRNTSKALIGTTIYIQCDSYGETRWNFNDPINSMPISDQKILVLYAARSKHSGWYYCWGKYFNSSQYFLASTYITVRYGIGYADFTELIYEDDPNNEVLSWTSEDSDENENERYWKIEKNQYKLPNLEISTSGCPSPQPIEHGYIEVYSLEIGSSITYVCYTGYSLKGVHSRKCLPGGIWSASQPKCIENRFCKELKPPINGFFTLTNKLEIGSIAMYHCYIGFILIGVYERVCMADLQWSFEPPICMNSKLIKLSESRTTVNSSHFEHFRILPDNDVSVDVTDVTEEIEEKGKWKKLLFRLNKRKNTKINKVLNKKL